MTQYYNNNFTAIIQMDLFTNYDTVDNSLLLNKMEHYRTRGRGWLWRPAPNMSS